MCAAKTVLSVISPKEEWTVSPKLKRKIIHEISPLTHKHHITNHYFNGSRNNEFDLKPIGNEDGLLSPCLQMRGTSQPLSPIPIHISPCSPNINENNQKMNSPNSYRLPSYLNLSGIGLSKLPLSPTMFDCCSPLGDSPCQRIPKNGFLYTPDRNDLRLGKGSYGNVTLCKYGRRPFALKIIKCSKLTKLGEKNFVGVKHRHLVSILKVLQLKDYAFIFMDFAGHSNLQQLLDNKADLAFEKRITFAQQIAAGLNHCHQLSIAHGDVKPINVIVNPKGICKLGDFGLSVKIGHKTEKSHHLNGFDGTAAYAAPEILKGMPMSLEADIYSFGITLWQLYTREIPFSGEHPHIVIYKVVKNSSRPVYGKFNDSISEVYAKLSIQCWDENPSLRPTSENVLTSLKNVKSFFKI